VLKTKSNTIKANMQCHESITKYITTQNEHHKLKPGIVTFNDIWLEMEWAYFQKKVDKKVTK